MRVIIVSMYVNLSIVAENYFIKLTFVINFTGDCESYGLNTAWCQELLILLSDYIWALATKVIKSYIIRKDLLSNLNCKNMSISFYYSIALI